jgi:Bacterial Ig-like domain (group 3)/FG-GAP-like repeat
MTRHFTRNFHIFSIVAIAALVTLAHPSSLAQPQATDPDKVSGQRSAVSMSPGVANQRLFGSGQRWRSRASHTGQGSSLFQPVVLYDSSEYDSYYWVAIADVNGDSKPDVVVAYQGNSGDGSVAVFLGNGDGTFQSPATYDSGAHLAYSVAIADVNGDGKPDLVVANGCTPTSCGEGSVGVLLGNGDGTFQAARTFASGGWNYYGSQAVIADVNGDGKSDVVVSNCAPIGSGDGCTDGGVLGVLLGNGDGTFQPVTTYATGGEASSLAVGDVNGDGKLDLIAANYDDTVAILLGNGDGTFQPAVLYGAGVDGVHTVAVADVNGDGKPDLLVGSCGSYGCGGGPDSGGVGVLLGNGDGTFQPVVTYDAEWVMEIVVADVNLDGKPDVVLADWAGDVGVLLGNGNGTFQPVMTFDSGASYADSVAVADVNGDGSPDAVVVNYCENGALGCVATAESSLGVLLNNTEGTATALTSSLNPSVYGQSVIFTASVSSSSGTPTGTVAFYNGPSAIGSATLTGGSASISVSLLASGSQSITAAYQGAGDYAPSTSSPLSQVVTTATTATTLASSANPAHAKQIVTYTATVGSQYGGAATGSVTFQDNGAVLATVPVSGNQASTSTSYSADGTHSIVATYSGDANNAASTSPVLTEKIEKAGKTYPSETTLATSGSPSYAGQPVTFTATVTSLYGTIPDGETVTFYDGRKADKIEIGTGTTSSGVATLTTSSLAAGPHPITAVYSGDSNFNSSSGKVNQAVDLYSTSTSISSSKNPTCAHTGVTFTAIVTSDGGPTPTGQVFFTGIGYATLSGGVASIGKRTGSPGHFGVTAHYEGDSFNKRSSAVIVEKVIYCGGGE